MYIIGVVINSVMPSIKDSDSGKINQSNPKIPLSLSYYNRGEQVKRYKITSKDNSGIMSTDCKDNAECICRDKSNSMIPSEWVVTDTKTGEEVYQSQTY